MSEQGCNIAFPVKHLIQTTGKRRIVRHGGTLCSKCLTAPPAPGQRYCNECHRGAQRDYDSRARRKRIAELEQTIIRATAKLERLRATEERVHG